MNAVLRTPVTPRARRVGGDGGEGASGGSVGRRSGRIPTTATTAATGSDAAATPASRTRRKVVKGVSVPEKKERLLPVVATDGVPEPTVDDAGAEHEDNDKNDEHDASDDILPPTAKRPAKTPLRRKEKHAKRSDGEDERPGPAGLLPGLGTMFQPSIDWLSEERREDYAVWKREVMREIGFT